MTRTILAVAAVLAVGCGGSDNPNVSRSPAVGCVYLDGVQLGDAAITWDFVRVVASLGTRVRVTSEPCSPLP